MEPMEETASLSSPLPELIVSLEQATLMAKQLPTTTEPNYHLQIYSSLHQTHQLLSTFLSKIQFPQTHLAPTAENSLSSATGIAADENGDVQMQAGEEDEVGEESSRGTIDRVEEKMRDCFIKNKRAKRPLSPSEAAIVEERRLIDDGFVSMEKGFDPHASRLRALDLVYQFHG